MAAKTAQHASQSFAQLVSKAQTNQLKPVIQQMIWDTLEPVLKAIEQRLIQDKEMLQIRQLALEEVLMSEIADVPNRVVLAIANVEDRAQGLKAVAGETATVQLGDKVRFDLSTKKDDVWLEPARMAIQTVGVVNTKNEYQTVKSLEEQLIGMTYADVDKELEVTQGNEVLKCKVTIKRISRKEVPA